LSKDGFTQEISSLKKTDLMDVDEFMDAGMIPSPVPYGPLRTIESPVNVPLLPSPVPVSGSMTAAPVPSQSTLGIANPQCVLPPQVEPAGTLTEEQNKVMTAIFDNLGTADLTYRISGATQRMHKIETQLVQAALPSTIDPDLAVEYQALAPYFDYRAMEDLLKAEGYSLDIHRNLSALLMALFAKKQYKYHPVNLAKVRVRRWLKKLAPLGGQSVEGYVFATSLTTKTKMMAIKIPRDVDNLMHEAMIGFYVTNHVRNWVINFPYTYGYTTCSPMIVSATFDNDKGEQQKPSSRLTDHNVVNWCTSNSPLSSVLMMENIADSVSLHSYLWHNAARFTFTQSMVIFWQLINALAVAGAQCGFTHYDLHFENILVKDVMVNRDQLLYYQGDVSQSWGAMNSNIVVYIIDLGLSYSVVKGQHFGRLEFNTTATNITLEHRPLYDLNFIIISWGHLIYYSKTYNTNNLMMWNYLIKVYATCTGRDLEADVKALNIFRERKSDDHKTLDIRRQWFDYYSQHYWPALWDILWSNIPAGETDKFAFTANASSPGDLPMQMDNCDFVKLVNVDQPPRDPIEFMDSYNALSYLPEGSRFLSGSKVEQLTALSKSFDIRTYLTDKGIHKLSYYLTRAHRHLKKITLPARVDPSRNLIVIGGSWHAIFDAAFEQWYTMQWNYLLSAYDKLHLFHFLLSNSISAWNMQTADAGGTMEGFPDELLLLQEQFPQIQRLARTQRRLLLKVMDTISISSNYQGSKAVSNWSTFLSPFEEITDARRNPL
jgi:hypothetical protein